MPLLQITGEDVQSMVGHWLGCPPNGYLGSSYGTDVQAMVQRSLSADDGNAFLDKLRQDVPIIQAAPAGTVNVYSADNPPDKRDILIEVAGQVISAQQLGLV
jgi:hypothetical protein